MLRAETVVPPRWQLLRSHREPVRYFSWKVPCRTPSVWLAYLWFCSAKLNCSIGYHASTFSSFLRARLWEFPRSWRCLRASSWAYRSGATTNGPEEEVQSVELAFEFLSCLLLDALGCFYLISYVCRPSRTAELAASIVGLTSFGLALGKSLNDAARDMIHAQKQIKSLRTHVQDFNSVLRHLARVLEDDNSICSSGALHDIKRIIRSCRKTFIEIHQAIKYRRDSRLLISVRWLFQKQHAKEIEARLDAQRSTLQSMIETITLSKMAEVAIRWVKSINDLGLS